jgi:hypothetical protein
MTGACLFVSSKIGRVFRRVTLRERRSSSCARRLQRTLSALAQKGRKGQRCLLDPRMLRALITHAREAKMRISRAIGRVKRQAKQGMAGLGEGLQSSVVPRPFRGAARRIAELLGANKPTARARKDQPRSHPAPSHEPYQPQVVSITPDHVTFTGTDSGVEPNDEPRDDTPVDPRAVGATPTYNATPLEVAPVEVTPIDATPVDATPLEIAPAALDGEAYGEVTDAEVTEAELSDAQLSDAQLTKAEVVRADVPHADGTDTRAVEIQPPHTADAELAATDTGRGAAPRAAANKPAVAAKPKTSPRAGTGNGKKRAAPPSDGATPKEKVAPPGEAAKTLARSGSGGSKKRSGPGAETSKKK